MKKILAYVLTLAMLVSCAVIPAYAADETYYISEDQYGFVRAMGSTYNSDYSSFSNVLTRGQVCKLLCSFGNFKITSTSGYEALFHDLSTDDYYYPNIKACYEGGIITGYPDGTFRSEEPMNSKDAARLLAYCIGYKSYVEVTSVDYVLNMTDIMDDVPVVDEMTQGMLYRMMYNAYHAPACVPNAVSSTGDVNYTISENYLGMELLERVRPGKGIVDGAVGTTLESPDETMIDGLMAVDGVTYVYDDDATALLGYEVDFYYQTGLNNKTNGNEIIWASKTDANREFVINYADLDDFSNFKYTYVKNNKYETVEISPKTDVILNGIANPVYTDEDMLPSYGEVVLIDNDRSSAGYEVAKIESYEFYLVDNVDLAKNIIYDQSEDIEKLDMEDADVINITWDGDEYPMERIIYGNFLKVKRTNPNSGYYLVDIEVLKNEKNNVKVEKATKDYVREAGLEHPLWTHIYDYEETSDYLQTGKIVTLYFSDGVVVRVGGANTDDSLYGYLMNVSAEGVISKKVNFRIMQSDATAVSYEMGKRVKLDGESLNDPDTIMTRLYNSVTAGDNIVYDEEGEIDTAKTFYARDEEAPYAQLIKYKLNADGNVIEIDTFVDGENEDEDTKLTLMEPAQSRYYKNTGLGNLYIGSDQHLVGFATGAARFMVPKTGRNDEENYKKFSLIDATTHTFQIADVDDEIFLAKAGCVFIDDATASEFTRHIKPAIVQSMETTLDENEDAQITVNCIYQKTTKTYVGKPEVFAGVDVGDVIRVIEDKHGKAEVVQIEFDISEYIPRAERSIDFNGATALSPLFSGYRVAYGTILAAKDGYMRFTFSTVDDQEYEFDPNYGADNISTSTGAKYWKYTNVRGVVSVTEATQSDIVTYSQNKDYPSKVMISYDHNSGGHNWVYIIEVQED